MKILPTFLHLPTKEQNKEFQKLSKYRVDPPQEPDQVDEYFSSRRSRLWGTIIVFLGCCSVWIVLGLLVWFCVRRGYGIP